MNNDRRKQITALLATITDAMSELETLRDEEQEAFDNMPEGLQESDRGQAASEAADNLDNACSSLQEVIDYLESATA